MTSSRRSLLCCVGFAIATLAGSAAASPAQTEELQPRAKALQEGHVVVAGEDYEVVI